MSIQVDLYSGRLELELEHSDYSLDEYLGYASRYNPKRGFLFVSKVLGKHIPVAPRKMRETYKILANKIPIDLPRPILFVGMAETAIGLGYGIFQEYCLKNPLFKDELQFKHTTRYEIDDDIAFVFEEEHSHATRHIVYKGNNNFIRQQEKIDPMSFRSIVLIDDEASTGKTFANFLKSAKVFYCGLENVCCITLTDWSGGKVDSILANDFGAENVSVISLLKGRYSFERNQKDISSHFLQEGNYSSKSVILKYNNGRLGVSGRDIIGGDYLSYFVNESRIYDDRFLAKIKNLEAKKILVLGTGEFVWEPFLFAEKLENMGFEVYFQSTTRSPIMLGNDIKSILSFKDNYDDNIDNYLYNVYDKNYDRIFVLSETPHRCMDNKFIQTMKSKFNVDFFSVL